MTSHHATPVLDSLGYLRDRLIRDNAPKVAGYLVAVCTEQQAAELTATIARRRGTMIPLGWELPPAVARALGPAKLLAVLYGDLVVGVVRR